MALDWVEVLIVSSVTIAGGYLSFHLLGWQAVLLLIAIASGIAYLLARRWGKLREKGKESII
jgi:membrane protein implicated in regulation of membrane protease activity